MHQYVRGVVGAGWLAGFPPPPLAGNQAGRCRPWQTGKPLPTRHAWSQRRPDRLLQLPRECSRPGGHRRSVSAAADPMQIQRGKKVIAPYQIPEKKKEKRKNILNGSIIKWLTFGVPFLR